MGNLNEEAGYKSAFCRHNFSRFAAWSSKSRAESFSHTFCTVVSTKHFFLLDQSKNKKIYIHDMAKPTKKKCGSWEEGKKKRSKRFKCSSELRQSVLVRRFLLRWLLLRSELGLVCGTRCNLASSLSFRGTAFLLELTV